MVGDTMVTVANATIPTEQWRGFLTPDAVEAMVSLYLQRHCPTCTYTFAAPTSGAAHLELQVTVASRAQLSFAIDRERVTVLPSADAQQHVSPQDQVAQQLAAEFRYVLAHSADLDVERLVQITASKLGQIPVVRSVRLRHNGIDKRRTMFTVRLPGEPEMQVSVLPLVEGRLRIYVRGNALRMEQAPAATSRMVQYLHEHGLAVELTSAVEWHRSGADDPSRISSSPYNSSRPRVYRGHRALARRS